MNNDDTIELKCDEHMRCRDVYLFHFYCPQCGDECLSGHDSAWCRECGWETKDFCYDISRSVGRNVVALTEKTIRTTRIGKKTVRKLIQSASGCCEYCGTQIEHEKYHIDHILPIAAGGTNLYNNLALSCPACNMIAGAKVFSSMHAKAQYIINRRYQKKR